MKTLSRTTPDPTGRVDLLISRVLETAVNQSGDPVLQSMYRQFKPDVDRIIGRVARKYNCGPALRKLGLAPEKQPRVKRSGRRVAA